MLTEPIAPERLAEIHEHDRRDRERGSVTASMVADIADHRTELLAEVDRLNERVAELIERLGETKGESHGRLLRVAELEGNLSAIRGWTRSRLEVLADRRRDYPETPEQRAKTAVLDDLTRVLDHLDTIPAPDTEAEATVDDLPGMWDQSDLIGGETDATATSGSDR